jgi:hypothetical protein
MCIVQLPPGDNPLPVKKNIIINKVTKKGNEANGGPLPASDDELQLSYHA